MSRLMPGDKVGVRPFSEISSSLDVNGSYQGMPFMPEMARHCGMRMTVLQRADKTCALNSEMQHLEDVVTLVNARCDGSEHGGCQLHCMLFWKEDWLERIETGESEDSKPEAGADAAVRLRTMREPGIYFCQATELTRASKGNLPRWSPVQYVRDLRSRTFTLPEFMRTVASLMIEKVSVMILPLVNNTAQGSGEAAPKRPLTLEVGDMVEVKGKKEIMCSLDPHGAHRGLGFTTDMFGCCSKRYRVKERVENIIHETTGEMRPIKNTVMLEGAACDRHRGCGRRMYFLWRESWLKKV